MRSLFDDPGMSPVFHGTFHSSLGVFRGTVPEFGESVVEGYK